MRKSRDFKKTTVDRTQCPICLVMYNTHEQPKCECKVEVASTSNPSRASSRARVKKGAKRNDN